MAATILMSMIFFVIAFGQATWRYNTVASIAKDAARAASLHGQNGVTVWTADSVQAYVNNRSQGMTLSVTTNWPDGGSNLSPNRVQVRVQGTYTPIAPLIPRNMLTLHSTAQALIAR